MTQGSAATVADAQLDAARAWIRTILLGIALTPEQREHQRRVLRQRVAGLAALVTIAVIIWTPVDLLLLEKPHAGHIIGARLVLSALLTGLWWNQRAASPSAIHPLIAVLGHIGIQSLVFAWMAFDIVDHSDAMARLGYGLLPFMVAAQIAVFPLPLIVSLALALLPSMLLLVPGWQGPFAPDLSLAGGFWLISLIALICAWAGAAQLSLLLDLLTARNDAAYDALTGLANRRSALARVEAEIAQAHRRGQPLALLALDFDHFKRVNDTYGHAAGDRVLMEFATVLRESLRLGDLGARVGGEEFIALLPQTEPLAAQHVAERIREQCELLEVAREDGAPIRFTISIGLAPLHPGDDTATLLTRADHALYRAKHSGRNRVVVSEEWSG